MGAAPWAFGLAVHHGTPVLTPAALAAHLAAAAVLAVLLARAERLLAAALGVAGAIRRRLAPPAPTRRPTLPVAGGPAARARSRRPRPRLPGTAARRHGLIPAGARRPSRDDGGPVHMNARRVLCAALGTGAALAAGGPAAAHVEVLPGGVVYRGGRIGVGRFQDFRFLGTPTWAGTALWRSRQTYADGAVKPWTGPPEAPGAVSRESGPTARGPAATTRILTAAEAAQGGASAAASSGSGDSSGAAVWLADPSPSPSPSPSASPRSPRSARACCGRPARPGFPGEDDS